MWPCSGISHRPEWRSTTGSRHCAGKEIQNWILYQDMHCGCREFKTEYFTPRHALWLQGIQIWILYQDVHCGCRESKLNTLSRQTLWLQGIQNWILYQDMHCGCREFKTEYFIKTCTGDRADFRFAPSQWETVLLCNNISHWLGASLESAQHALWLNGIQNWIRY